mmetsp:Transcript_20194/g.63785  ORF Transcript_20194/g.63785 Transcript_20194/m.63785 type:complete len:89 (-) Transcript_20194:1031-1297(-)
MQYLLQHVTQRCVTGPAYVPGEGLRSYSVYAPAHPPQHAVLARTSGAASDMGVVAIELEGDHPAGQPHVNEEGRARDMELTCAFFPHV